MDQNLKIPKPTGSRCRPVELLQHSGFAHAVGAEEVLAVRLQVGDGLDDHRHLAVGPKSGKAVGL